MVISSYGYGKPRERCAAATGREELPRLPHLAPVRSLQAGANGLRLRGEFAYADA